MSDMNFPWLEELALKKQDFATIPDGEVPLIWAFKNDLLKEEAYTTWASNHYKVPSIKPEFFSLAVDFSLCEKFSKLHTWESTCYPVYSWQDTLFIACLEPVSIEPSQKVCFIIAPFSELTNAWEKNHQDQDKSVIAAPDLAALDLTVEEPTVVTQSVVENKEIDNPNTSAQPEPKAEDASPSLEALDFSNLQAPTEEPAKPTQAEQAPIIPPPPVAEEIEWTQTNAEDSINAGTSVTTLMKSEESPLQESSFKDLIADNEADIPPPPTPMNLEPALDEMADTQLGQTVTDSKVNKSQASAAPVIEEPQQETPIDDDYTPLPFVTKTEQTSSKVQIHPALEEVVEENTVTDHAQPSHIPAENLISTLDLSENTQLNADASRKGVIAHIFHLLKRDYKELMWTEFSSDNQYFPKFCFGAWSMDPKSWTVPINVTQPNIFKIAYNSHLPFHGEINDNPFNEKYYELWLKNQRPDFATVYPVVYDDYCYGFIVGFSKGPEFDEVGSLKKIENLISICKSAFLSSKNKKAA